MTYIQLFWKYNGVTLSDEQKHRIANKKRTACVVTHNVLFICNPPYIILQIQKKWHAHKNEKLETRFAVSGDTFPKTGTWPVMQLCNWQNQARHRRYEIASTISYSVLRRYENCKRQNFVIFECGHSLKTIYVKAVNLILLFYSTNAW